MKISRFLTLAILVTFLSLLYVWQQTEIFRLAYRGEENEAAFQDLLDKNSILRYNLKKNASLVYIGQKISGLADFQMPDDYRLVRFERPKEVIISKYLPNRENLLSRLFGVRRQAEAKTVSPSPFAGVK